MLSLPCTKYRLKTQTIIRNKATLVAKGFAQEEDDVKTGIFLMGPLKRRFMLHNQTRFVNPDHPDKVYRIRKGSDMDETSFESLYEELFQNS
ncbi:hypothetical protein Tco_1304391 [Tanacetum coccineum]